ncbi:MAG: hypothetical protein IJU51_07600 [Clostridia bacterium]|nr:hypothetical protein [Clostridia bacterium]
MKEAENAEAVRNSKEFYAQELETIISLSDILQADALRYDRRIDAEEDVYEL